jgi:acyl carrier protein
MSAPFTMTLDDELMSVLRASGATLPDDLDDQTSLIRSGILDSTALFALALWVEEKIPDLDLTVIDLAAEWDTVARLLAFLKSRRRTNEPSAP